MTRKAPREHDRAYRDLFTHPEARLAGATPAQLNRWAEKVLTAGSLDEIWG